MTIVDTHCHIGLSKYEPVESLLFHMQRSGVSKAVLIQYMGNTDNTYLLEAMSNHPGRFSAAMIVANDDDGKMMRKWSESGIPGIRLPLKARGADPLAQWRTASELGHYPTRELSESHDQATRLRRDLRTAAPLHICPPAGRHGPGGLWPQTNHVGQRLSASQHTRRL